MTHRLGAMMALATAIAAAGAAGGLYLSYYADTAAGASIAALLVAVHVCTARYGSTAAKSPGQWRASNPRAERRAACQREPRRPARPLVSNRSPPTSMYTWPGLA